MSSIKEGLARTGVSIEELRGKIVRATSWGELFSSREQEMADFMKNLIGIVKAEYEGKHSLKQYRVEQLPEGDLHVFEHTIGYLTTYQKLKSNGNVVMTFNYPDRSSNNCLIVTPDVGNVAHGFTAANTILPDREFLEQLGGEKLRSVTGTHLAVLTFHIKGKPATKEWEKAMLLSGYFPQRIGHRVYASFFLEAQVPTSTSIPPSILGHNRKRKIFGKIISFVAQLTGEHPYQ